MKKPRHTCLECDRTFRMNEHAPLKCSLVCKKIDEDTYSEVFANAPACRQFRQKEKEYSVLHP